MDHNFFRRSGNVCGIHFLQKNWPTLDKYDRGRCSNKTMPTIGGHQPVPSLSSFQQRVGDSNVLHHPHLLEMGLTHDNEENLSMPYMIITIWQNYGFSKFQSVFSSANSLTLDSARNIRFSSEEGIGFITVNITQPFGVYFPVRLFPRTMSSNTIPRDGIFIGPETDHWLCLSLTNLLTDSLTAV